MVVVYEEHNSCVIYNMCTMFTNRRAYKNPIYKMFCKRSLIPRLYAHIQILFGVTGRQQD